MEIKDESQPPKDLFTVFVPPPFSNLVTFHEESLALLAFLSVYKVTPFKLEYTYKQELSPTKSLPMIDHPDSNLHGGLWNIIEHLTTVFPEKFTSITPTESALAASIAVYFHQVFHPFHLHILNHKGTPVLQRSTFFSRIPWPVSLLYRNRTTEAASNYLEDIHYTEEYRKKVMIPKLSEIFECLSAKLGRNDFMCGDQVGVVDCIAYGYLTYTLNAFVPHASSRKTFITKHCQALEHWLARMDDLKLFEAWRQDEQDWTKKTTKKNGWDVYGTREDNESTIASKTKALAALDKSYIIPRNIYPLAIVILGGVWQLVDWKLIISSLFPSLSLRKRPSPLVI